MQLLRKWLALPAEERGLVLMAGAAVALARLGLWLLPSHTLRRLAAYAPRITGAATTTPERIGWAVAAASACVPQATCLTQALAACALLRLHRHSAELRIGVMRDSAGQLAAHAWVASGETVIIGGTQASLAPFAVLAPQTGQGQ
ncbi:MAG: lasso peptide biosynthesis B2 protein [Oscillochloris sp.]|nr:lasso peptide biosynthesis B2 protein [Oscillochloris sp.]